VARIMKLAETNLDTPVGQSRALTMDDKLKEMLDKFEIQKAINRIWEQMGELDAEIQEVKPWESKDKEVIAGITTKLAHIGYSLAPFMPETSEKILVAIKKNKMPETLFPRINA